MVVYFSQYVFVLHSLGVCSGSLPVTPSMEQDIQPRPGASYIRCWFCHILPQCLEESPGQWQKSPYSGNRAAYPIFAPAAALLYCPRKSTEKELYVSVYTRLPFLWEANADNDRLLAFDVWLLIDRIEPLIPLDILRTKPIKACVVEMHQKERNCSHSIWKSQEEPGGVCSSSFSCLPAHSEVIIF